MTSDLDVALYVCTPTLCIDITRPTDSQITMSLLMEANVLGVYVGPAPQHPTRNG
jgi:hypothetical protein